MAQRTCHQAEALGSTSEPTWWGWAPHSASLDALRPIRTIKKNEES